MQNELKDLIQLINKLVGVAQSLSDNTKTTIMKTFK